MNRQIWQKIKGFVSLQNYPVLPCPYCANDSLTIDEKSIGYRKAIHPEKTAVLAKEMKTNQKEVTEAFQSKTFLGVLVGIGTMFMSAQKTPAKFICFFKCANCGGEVSATGTSQHAIRINDQVSVDTPSLKVEYFSPPIPIFNISSLVPIPVREEVLQSFNHFHSDLASSGAKLRRSIEKLCLELGFKEKNLHCSLSAMEKDYPEEVELLHSLKLLGNEATHSDEVNEDDLLDAFEVEEFVLGLFERTQEKKQIVETAKKLKQKFNKS